MSEDDTPDDEEPHETEPEVAEGDGWVGSHIRPLGASMADSLTGGARAGFDAGYGFGSSIVNGVNYAVSATVMLFTGLLISTLRLVPRGEKLWKGVAQTGIRGFYKSSGGDAIGFIARENGIDLEAVKWKHSAPDDPSNPNRWVTKSGERWHPGGEGRTPDFIGSTPVVLLDEDATARGSMLQSRYQAALDLGHKDALFVPERVEQVVVQVDPQAAEEGGPAAIADGGAVAQEISYAIPDSEWPDKLADVLVDLRSPSDAEGMRVSARAYKDVYLEDVGAEEMQMQELRGRAAEADPQKERELMFRVLKWVAIAVLAARAPELLAMLGGSDAGGIISDLNPLWLAMMALPV